MTLYTSSDIVMESFLPFREPPETDLEYYARPENYTGSNLKTLTRFIIAKNKETIKSETQSKECESVKEENILAERYNHVLPIQLSTYEICSINSTVSRDYENKPLFHANTEQLHQTLNNSARNQNESELNTEKEVPGHGEPTWSVLNKKGEKIIGRCNSVPAADHMKLNVDHWNLKGENFIDRCNDTFVKETLLTEVKCWKIRSKSASDILGPRNSSNRTITKGRSSKNIHRSISKDRHQQQDLQGKPWPAGYKGF